MVEHASQAIRQVDNHPIVAFATDQGVVDEVLARRTRHDILDPGMGLRSTKRRKSIVEGRLQASAYKARVKNVFTSLSKQTRVFDVPPPLGLDVEGGMTSDRADWKKEVQCLACSKFEGSPGERALFDSRVDALPTGFRTPVGQFASRSPELQ